MSGTLAAGLPAVHGMASMPTEHRALTPRTADHGGIAYFDTGRFLAETGDQGPQPALHHHVGASVQHGTFSSHVRIENLTIGETSFHAQLDEMIEVGAVRIYAAAEHDRYRLLSDDDIARGAPEAGPVRFALARDLDAARYRTSLDVMQGRTFGHMIATNGSADVRIDALLAIPLYDNKPGVVDGAPEVLIFGDLREPQTIRVTAIIGGSPDEPILGQKTAVLTADEFNRGRTGVTMIMADPFASSGAGAEMPVRISIVGLDLYGHLGLEHGVEARGVRIEIPAFDAKEPAVIGVLGSGRETQRVLAHDQRIVDDPQDIGLALGPGSGRGPSGGAWSIGGGVGGSAGGRGMGGGGGGGGGSARRGGSGIGSQPQLPNDPTPPPPSNGDNGPVTGGGGGGGAGNGGGGAGNGGGNGGGGGGNGGGGGGGGGGNGFGHTPVPTPATLTLLTIAMLFGRRRARIG